jgi:hypothetical protein
MRAEAEKLREAEERAARRHDHHQQQQQQQRAREDGLRRRAGGLARPDSVERRPMSSGSVMPGTMEE